MSPKRYDVCTACSGMGNVVTKCKACKGTGRLEVAGTRRGKPWDDGVIENLVGLPLSQIERDVIMATLKRLGGNKSEAAHRLGISRNTLNRKLEGYKHDSAK